MPKPCTNNPTEKSAAIALEMSRLRKPRPGMIELYRRGCFRHVEDVSYAVIMLDRHQTVEQIAADLDSSYEGPKAVVHHRCDRVYPPS